MNISDILTEDECEDLRGRGLDGRQPVPHC